MRFVRDLKKATNNIAKHGVSFEEAATLFGDPLALTVPDPVHPVGEYRFLTLGLTTTARLVVVSHAERVDDEIRIISARVAERSERKDYEG